MGGRTRSSLLLAYRGPQFLGLCQSVAWQHMREFHGTSETAEKYFFEEKGKVVRKGTTASHHHASDAILDVRQAITNVMHQNLVEHPFGVDQIGHRRERAGVNTTHFSDTLCRSRDSLTSTELECCSG